MNANARGIELARGDAPITEKPRRVLCAIQDERPRLELTQALATWELVVVSTAFEAVRAMHAAGSSFDAYLLSYFLPDLAGVGLCQDIRAMDPHGPICFYTHGDKPSYRRRALKAGAHAYLCRDDGPEAVREHLQALLFQANVNALSARSAAQAAVEYERARRAMRARQPRPGPMRIAGVTREKCMKAFFSAKGSLADFERWWSTVLETAPAPGGGVGEPEPAREPAPSWVRGQHARPSIPAGTR